MNKIVSAVLMFTLVMSQVRAQDETEKPDKQEKDSEGIIPISPVKLFDALPANPKTWELKRSIGTRSYSGWVESRVQRIFEKKVIDPKKPDEPEKVLVTRVTITDTGKFSEAIAGFDDFKPEKHENYEKAFIQKYPAVIVPYEGEVEVTLLVKGRFKVEYILENQPKKYLKEWMRHTKFDVLTKIADTPVTVLPAEINILKIDQLNPKKNSVYLLATSSNSQQAKDLAEEEILQKKIDGEIPVLPGELDFLLE